MRISKLFIYAGKKLLSAGTKLAERGSKTTAEAATQAAKKPVYKGPTLSEVISKQPKALPAPTAEQLAASKPLLNTAKLTGYGPDQLDMTQVIAKDGTHIRYYRKPGQDRVIFETRTNGALRREKYMEESGDFTELKAIGDDMRLTQKKGSVLTVNSRSVAYDRGKNQKIGWNTVTDSRADGGLQMTEYKGVNGSTGISGKVYQKNDESEFVKGPLKYELNIAKFDSGNHHDKFISSARKIYSDGSNSSDYGFSGYLKNFVKKIGFKIDDYGKIDYKFNILDDLLKPFKE